MQIWIRHADSKLWELGGNYKAIDLGMQILDITSLRKFVSSI